MRISSLPWVLAACSAAPRPPTPEGLTHVTGLANNQVAAMVWGCSWASDAVDLAKLEAVRSVQDVDAPEPGFGCAR